MRPRALATFLLISFFACSRPASDADAVDDNSPPEVQLDYDKHQVIDDDPRLR